MEPEPKRQKSSSPKDAPGCPFAAAILADEEASSSSSSRHSRHSPSTTDDSTSHQQQEQWFQEVEQAAKTKCPAFSSTKNGSTSTSCPFSQSGGSDPLQDVQATLLELPESHLQPDGLFYKSLQHLHTTPTGSSMLKAFAKECPVTSSLKNGDVNHEKKKQWSSFQEAMEEFSLAAIMAKLATEQQQGEESFSGATSKTAIDMPEGKKQETTDPKHPSSPVQDGKPSPPPPPRTTANVNLSEALKTGTAASHTQAEEVHFVKNFIRGKIDRELYGQLVLHLYHIYVALETALDQQAPTYFSSLHFPKELHRAAALQEDVDFWHTTLPEKPSAATQDYIDRIRYCQEHQPLLLLAHAYTRYLGDLSGGKILARVARRALNLEKDGEGLAFYEFPNIPSAKLFKDQYRNALNALELTQEQVSALVHEANIAFGLNMRVFEELDVAGGVVGAQVRPLQDIYDVADKAASFVPPQDDPAAAECPFIVNKKSSPKNSSSADDASNGDVHKKQGTCPWPFILLHDPKTGMQCWQSWLVMGLVLMWTYRQFVVNGV